MIRWLEQVRADDVDLVGGKGASLGEMLHAGLPVPAGFCVTVHAYRAAVEPLHQQVLALLAAGEHDQLRQVVAQAALPAGLLEQVAFAVEQLDGPLAVRSSATAEDLPDASFAGQQETVLGAVGTQDVLAALRRCWASLWSDRAIAYRYEQGFAHQEVALAVVVQRMVPADAAGVAFTADPVTGQRAAVVIESSWGLGESVVSGAVTPDTFVVSGRDRSRAQGGAPRRDHGHHQGRSLPWAPGHDWWTWAGERWRLAGTGRSRAVVSRRLGDKRSRTDLAPTGATRTRGTTARERRRFSLTSAQARQVAVLARRVEAYEGHPVDIEWAVAGGRLWLLQARPITTLEAAGAAGPVQPAGSAATAAARREAGRRSLRDRASLFPARRPGRLSRADMVSSARTLRDAETTSPHPAWRSPTADTCVMVLMMWRVRNTMSAIRPRGCPNQVAAPRPATAAMRRTVTVTATVSTAPRSSATPAPSRPSASVATTPEVTSLKALASVTRTSRTTATTSSGGPAPAHLGLGLPGLSQVTAASQAWHDLVEVEDVEVAIGGDPVPTAVLVVVGGEEVRPHRQLGRLVGPQHVVDDVVALDVDVGVDLVGHLEGEGGQPHGAVVGGRRQPLHAAPTGHDPPAGGVPEADVVALGRVALDLLLVGEVLLAPEEQQVGDRGGGVGAAQQGGDDNAPRGAQGYGVGPHPAGCCHGLVDVLLVALDGKVDRVTQQAVGGAGPPDEVLRDVEPGEHLVQARQGEVGQHHPEEDDVEGRPRLQVPPGAEQEPGEPQGGQGGGGEEERVQDVIKPPAAGLRG